MVYKLKTNYKKMLADTITPVNLYLKIRDKFPKSILLESSDYHGNENSFSYLCFNQIAYFKVQNEIISEKFPDGNIINTPIKNDVYIPHCINNFAKKFESDKLTFNFISNGLFGYISYDAVRYFEDIEISRVNNIEIPDIYYGVYEYVIAINHFKNEMYIFEHQHTEDEKNQPTSNISFIESLIQNRNFASYNFNKVGGEQSNFNDNEFLEILSKGKEHVKRGDVFQIVLSRRFNQKFTGDEFNVYRALRSINPSPYLFYFDYGSFKIFGSSPESQIQIKGNKASINPIAGTFERTGDDVANTHLAEKLKNDPKENSEHVMLVDLARNDLSRNGTNVKVEKFKEIQFYSHVIHLVSKVSCDIYEKNSTMKIVADTFPAGTLSGAPKHKAMQLINKYEKNNRGFYGGCIGFIGFNGDFNHAITIRSFLSKDNILYYQAGAGVVAKSEIKNELKEVNNKLLALRKAIDTAEKL